MATFVFVSGAWQGGWIWKRVATRLRQSGHEVFTPTLTGLGERAHLLDDKIDLDTHIQDILGVIQCEELSDIVLCGHSYGGMVITGAADQASGHIRSLVYLDALVPADGQKVFDLQPPETAAAFQEVARTRGSGFRIPPAPAEDFGVNIENQAWVDLHTTDHPLKTFQQAIRLEDKWKQVRRLIYIYATGWRPGIGKPFFDKVRQDENWEVFSLPSSHDVMVDRPEQLTEILLAAV